MKLLIFYMGVWIFDIVLLIKIVLFLFNDYLQYLFSYIDMDVCDVYMMYKCVLVLENKIYCWSSVIKYWCLQGNLYEKFFI